MWSSFSVVVNYPPHVWELHDAPHLYDEASVYIWVVGFSCIFDEWLLRILCRHHKIFNFLCPSSTIVLSKFPLKVLKLLTHFCLFQGSMVKPSHFHSSKLLQNFPNSFSTSLMKDELILHNDVIMLKWCKHDHLLRITKITKSDSHIFSVYYKFRYSIVLGGINWDFDGCIKNPNDISISIIFEMLSMHDSWFIFMFISHSWL